jgi:superfamily I DNA/RNA helicase
MQGATVLRLEENYRSTQEILDVSNWLLGESTLNYDKSLRAARGTGVVPKLFESEDEYGQADYVTQTILDAYSTGEEERRVLYVAMTRAADELHICRSRRGWSSQRADTNDESYFFNRLPSRFVKFDSDITKGSRVGNFSINF